MLAACISERAKRLQLPSDLPEPQDRESLAGVLTAFGTRLLHETSDPTVVAVFRLAIAEANAAPEIAQALNSIALQPTRAALKEIMVRARTSQLLNGQPAEMAEQFAALLWSNLPISLLLRVADQPDKRDIARRAGGATTAFLRLYPRPAEQRSAKEDAKNS
jgi:hypothetical protein